MKAEGRAEVYERYVLSSMPLRRRIPIIAYVVWLFMDGLFGVLGQFLTPMTPNSGIMTGMETPLLHFVASGFLLVLLHSYIAQPFAKNGFRLVILGHQLGLITLSLWKTIVGCNWGIQSWLGIGGTVLYYCAMREIEAFILGIIEEWSEKSN